MSGMLGISMFLVGAVLFLNGLWLMGVANTRSVGIFNLLVGLFCTLMAFNNHVHAGEIKGHLDTANTLLFAFTYLMVAANCLLNLDGKALGWFSLYVATATIPNSIVSFAVGDYRFSVIWFMWGLLWFIFFMSSALSNSKAVRIAPYLSIIVGIIFTGIPGYMILWNLW